MKIFSYIFSIFTEKKCFWCRKSGHFFCPQCNKYLETYTPYCYVCKKESKNFSVHNICQKSFPIDKIVVLTRYRNKWIKKLIRHAKYYGKYKSYEDIIQGNVDFFQNYIHPEDSILVPVSMHFLRRWKRGYNQTDKIAKYLSKVCQIPVKKNFLVRSRYSKQQSHLSVWERNKNLSWVFSLKNRNSVDKSTSIYLIDDVISTWSTVLEITRLLNKNGYNNVSVICLSSD